MERIATTPFGARPVTSGHLAWVEEFGEGVDASERHDKWALFDALREGRGAFGVSDRDLTVLCALLSFHPGRELGEGPLVVFPSNRALGERAHGMAESTLRRHLAALVQAGLVLRHDSPNGKRYAARDWDGQIVRAFGFDLTPLVARSGEIQRAAEIAREAALELKLLRDEVSVRLRDAEKLAAYGFETGEPGAWPEMIERAARLRRVYRRRIGSAELRALLAETETLLAEIQAALMTGEPDETEKSSGNAVVSERHYQNSNPDSLEPESCKEERKERVPRTDQTAIPFGLVQRACHEISLYGPDGLSDWAELERRADVVRGMLGVSPDAWYAAQQAMGSREAAIVMACILERAAEIRSAGGYLRALTDKAGQGAFSPLPMVLALLNRHEKAA